MFVSYTQFLFPAKNHDFITIAFETVLVNTMLHCVIILQIKRQDFFVSLFHFISQQWYLSSCLDDEVGVHALCHTSPSRLFCSCTHCIMFAGACQGLWHLFCMEVFHNVFEDYDSTQSFMSCGYWITCSHISRLPQPMTQCPWVWDLPVNRD